MFQSVKERRAERRAKLAWAIPRRECFKAWAKERMAQKNFAPQPRVLSLDCSAKLRWNPSVMKKCFIKRFSVSVFAVSVSVFKILSVKWGVSSGLEMKKVPFRRHLTVMQISLFWFEYKLLCHYSTSLWKSLTKCSSLFVFWLNQLLHRCNKKQCCWRNPYT